MQDIANACGLSRNTVSKVFNGRGTVPQTTRELVLRTAKEIGYGSPVNESSAVSGSAGNIALLTRFFPGENHFGSTFLTSFTDWISRSGYSMKIYEISAEELRDKRLPPHFIPDQIAGILGIEIFDPDYLNMICTLGIPTVLTDSPADGISSLMACDYVTMENMAGVSAIVRQQVKAGQEGSVLWEIRITADLSVNGGWVSSSVSGFPAFRWTNPSVSVNRTNRPIPVPNGCCQK